MKKVILLLSIVTLVISCNMVDKKDKKSDDNQDKMGMSMEVPVIDLADFDAKAGDFVNKEVQVKGIVDHVCKHGGKRLLLVTDEGDVHVDSEERFDDSINGDEIVVNGLVTEFRVDEAYLLQKEEDHIQSHKEGKDSQEIFDEKMEHIKEYRDSMKAAGVDHLSFYSLDYLSHKVLKEVEVAEEEINE